MSRRKQHEELAERSGAGLRVVELAPGSFYVFEDDWCRLGKPLTTREAAQEALEGLEERDRERAAARSERRAARTAERLIG